MLANDCAHGPPLGSGAIASDSIDYGDYIESMQRLEDASVDPDRAEPYHRLVSPDTSPSSHHLAKSSSKRVCQAKGQGWFAAVGNRAFLARTGLHGRVLWEPSVPAS